MLVKMKVGLSGPAYSLGPGDEREFPDSEAIRLIDAGYADPVSAPQVERAVAVPTIERRGRKGRQNVVSGDGNVSGDGAASAG